MLSAREITKEDIELIASYWLSADKDFLAGMGADIGKIPSQGYWVEMLLQQLEQGYEEKKSYATIWEADGKAVGHCNINKIIFGSEAYMHLHLWNTDSRQKGMGAQLVKLSLPYFFGNCKLKTLYCEPYALNPAPNKTLEKTGFTFVREYVTTPGFLNFEQPVKLWEMSYDTFKSQQ